MDYAQIYKQINEHPGKQAHDNWSNLRLTYAGIFVTNRHHLLTLLNAPKHDEELRIELVQNVRPQDIKVQYESEMLRLIHNYIASSSSLIDHSRRFIKRYSGSSFSNEYDVKRNEVSNTLEHNFLKDLRNYLLHYDIPPIGWSLSLEDKGQELFTPRLTSSKLLVYKKWSAASKQYIAKHEAFIDLIPLFEQHGEKVDDLYNWIFEQFHIIHGKEIDDVNRLIGLTIPEHVKQMRNEAKG